MRWGRVVIASRTLGSPRSVKPMAGDGFHPQTCWTEALKPRDKRGVREGCQRVPEEFGGVVAGDGIGP